MSGHIRASLARPAQELPASRFGLLTYTGNASCVFHFPTLVKPATLHLGSVDL